MADRLKELPAKILEWWNKFTSKQKTIIVSITAVVIFTFAIIIYTFTRPNFVEIANCETTAEASKIVNILEDAGVTHRESDNGLTIEVEKSQQSVARLAMGSAGYVPKGVSLKDFLDTSMSTTASDREKQYQQFLEAELEAAFSNINALEGVGVLLNIPPQTGTLSAQQEPSSAYIQLKLKSGGVFSSANATAMARAAATYLGNNNTANITILDQDGNILFAGGDDYSVGGIATSMQELSSQAESMISSQMKRVLYGTGQFNMIEVAGHVDVDYSHYEETLKEYYANDDRTEGMWAESAEFSSSSSGGLVDIPGTDSNDDDNNNTTYPFQNGGSTESESEERNIKYLPNERAVHSLKEPGTINYDTSSMAIALIKYHDYYEDAVRRQGLLDGLTWDAFKDSNSADIRLDVDPDYYALAANATGISQDRITIIAYERPVFHDKEGWTESDTSTTVSIGMILLILALLAFVVLRSMRARKAEEQEEELSVESMLQSTADTGLEDLDVETKSEVRVLVEKFVDENPQAAANLLRNWLNEDWA